MSDFENTMSMHSLMDAIYGINNMQQTYQTLPELNQTYQTIDRIPEFMQSLMNHLMELCLSQSAAENVAQKLKPWIIESAAMMNRNPKKMIQSFFSQYLSLLEHETQKINKYSSKKLNYLTKTVSRQIFTQIMRMSCDLKLQNINRANHHRVILRRINNTNLITGAIQRSIVKNINGAFKCMKANYLNSIEKEDSFIENLTISFNKLNYISKRNKKLMLQKGLELWRKKTILLNVQQTSEIMKIVTDFSQHIIPSVIQSWKKNPNSLFKQASEEIIKLVSNNFSEANGISIKFYPDTQIAKEKIQNLSYSESDIQSYRSNLTENSSLFSCLRRGEIKYDHDQNSATIPFFTEHPIGIFVLNWTGILPLTFFHKILRILEMIKEILGNLQRLGTRLTYYQEEYKESQWEIDVFNLQTNQIKTNLSLQMPLDNLNQNNLEQIEQILDKAQINFLEIYHDVNSVQPCITYGDHQAPQFQTNIYQLIWQKLETTKCFILERDGVKYNICGINFSGKYFCRFLYAQSQNTSSPESQSIILQSIVPLIIRRLDKIGCNSCSKSYNIAADIKQQQKQAETDLLQLPLLLHLKQSKSLQQIQSQIFQTLRHNYAQLRLFGKLFYCIDQQLCEYAFTQCNISHKIDFQQLPKSLTLGHSCSYNLYGKESNLIQWIRLISLLHKNSLISKYESTQLYIYEKQKTNQFRIIPFRIGRKALLILGTYQYDLFLSKEKSKSFENTKFINNIEAICSVINDNNFIFQKKDAMMWSNTIVYQSADVLFPNQQFEDEIIKKAKQQVDNKLVYSIDEIMKMINSKIGIIDSTHIWKVIKNQKYKVSRISGKFQGQKIEQEFLLKYLLNQPLQSHQKLTGAHRILRRTKFYGQKLRQILTYIPIFENKSKTRAYAQILLSKLESKGQLSDSICNQLMNVISQTTDYDKIKQNFISIPITLRLDQPITLILVLTYGKKQVINEKTFNICCNYYRQLLTKIFLSRYQVMKKNRMSAFNQSVAVIMKKRNYQRIKNIVYIFAQNYRENQRKVSFLYKKLYQTVHSIDYRQIKHGFTILKKRNNSIIDSYLRGSDFLRQKLIKIFGLSKLINAMSIISQKTEGVNSMTNTLSSILYQDTMANRFNINKSFKELILSAQIKGINHSIRRKQAVLSLNRILRQLERKRTMEFFRKNYCRKQMLLRDLILIKEEFQILDFQGVRGCQQFLATRLGIVFNQYYQPESQIKVEYFFNNISKKQDQNNILNISNFQIKFITNVNNQKSSLSLTQEQKKIMAQLFKSILPQWQLKLKIILNNNAKILAKTIESLIKKRSKLLFSVMNHDKIAYNLTELHQMNSRVILAQSQMEQVKNKNTYDEIVENSQEGRQAHIKQIDEINGDLRSLQNQGQKLEVELKIKRKTNAIYEIDMFLNKHKQNRQSSKENNNSLNNKQQRFTEQIQTIKAKVRQIKKFEKMKMLTLWVKRLQRIINKRQKIYFAKIFSHAARQMI